MSFCSRRHRPHSKMELAGLTVLIGSLAVLWLSFGCGDDDSKPAQPAPPENEVLNNLTLAREGGAAISSGDMMAVCCSVWESGYIDKLTLKILCGDSAAAWKLFILVDEAAQSTVYTLPIAGVGVDPVNMFIVDFTDGNEANSDLSESTGTITINSFSCGPPVTVDVSINATIASENGRPKVEVAGTFECTVHSNPAPFGCDFSI